MQKNPRKIRAIIFDLDDTLYDCSGTLVLRGRRQVAGKIARLIKCSEEEAYSLQLEIEEKYGVKANIYEKIVSHYHLPGTYAQELLEDFVHINISNITVFPDVMDTVIQLKARGYRVALVTSGDKEIQRKKIDVLGLNNRYFDDIVITDRNKGQSKKACFQEIMKRYDLQPKEFVCVGDKIDDELAASKSLGMFTVMFEHGRHYNAYLKVQDKYIKPDYFIKHIKNILELEILNNLQVS
ncbi:MAG: HAD family hydrolase [Candidatus Brocadiaceae bacterium]|uniref:HAD family hydrolase n=1 Tax=Candidatus Wunengus sp. YC61 TaxID=3367698 RepID=UPI002719FA99|nr:HAD family hydrolase [Candidatus Brocadiaceae bacterium]